MGSVHRVVVLDAAREADTEPSGDADLVIVEHVSDERRDLLPVIDAGAHQGVPNLEREDQILAVEIPLDMRQGATQRLLDEVADRA